jgi:predicted nucleotidyltransferase component of viral defense system
MIPTRLLLDWRTHAPWPTEDHVEQDLILTRLLVMLFTDAEAASMLAFRGGTALHKLVFEEAGRYSEDLDLVQRKPGPIKPVLEVVQPIIESLLGKANVDLRRDGVRLTWRYEAEASGTSRRIKVEINTREHESFDSTIEVPVACDTRWFTGRANVVTYTSAELLATKMRALYQRKKGRDLFDLGLALATLPVDGASVAERFRWCLARQRLAVSTAEFQANLDRKVADPRFGSDVGPPLRAGIEFDASRAAALVSERLIANL